MLDEILILNSLKKQHIIDPLESAEHVIREAIGFQAQYLQNAIFAVSIRHNNLEAVINPETVCKVWSFRGTLHIHNNEDVIPIVRILKDIWFANWGKYMDNIFSDAMRRYLHDHTRRLIALGFCSRQLLREESDRLGIDRNLICQAYSSWGGVLKDLNYNGEIGFSEYDKLNFCLKDRKKLNDRSIFLFRTELVKRYFRFYGPATLADFCYWMGFSLSLGKQWITDVEADLMFLEDGKNNKYFYLGELVENIDAIPKCVFLCGFDPLMLAYKNKSRWISHIHYHKVFLKNGFMKNVILINGKAEAIWKRESGVLKITLFEHSVTYMSIINDFIYSNRIFKHLNIKFCDNTDL